MSKELRMRGVCMLGLLLGLIGIIQAEPSIFSGYLGCRFSESICRRNEECVDDHLFGLCQSLDQPRDLYQYSLDSSQLRALEREIGGLIEGGNTWEDLYTQCVLSNMLYSFRWRNQYNPAFCDNGGVQTMQQDLSDTAVALLKSYLETYYNAVAKGKLEEGNRDRGDTYKASDVPFDGLSPYDRLEIPNPDEKKDEVVQVHKYMKSHKRDPYQQDYPDYSSPGGVSSPEYQSPGGVSGPEYQSPGGVSGPEYQSYDITDEYPAYDELLGSLTPEKLALLQEYFGPVSKEEDSPKPTGTSLPSDYTDMYNNIIGSMPAEDNYAVVASMEPQDAELLDNLLQGKTQVSSLSDDKIERLTRYVDTMLASLRKIQPQDEDHKESEDMDIPNLEPPATEEGLAVDQSPVSQELGVHKAVKKEQSNEEALATDPDAAGDSRASGPQQTDDLSNPDPTKPQFGVVDLDVTYIKVQPDIKSKTDAATLLVDIERHLKLPDDTFASPRLSKNEINFHVKPNLLRMNASAVASQAKLHADEIKNETGYLIYEAGVGSFESKVPLDNHEPKYFVLTFVLCGVIAGIVLAVIAIYIVRRHLQSKEKLAQLSGAADGVEASNDYQDLCRQRMQSKSSEKPEPLHVASRVGSVSAAESAVRSPSSRSSTSSWSEEPVASNMDISTGHIVLSYMEDHLKNKDRLDREWEALCAYEAEPNSITTASETSNMRKNRYSDILPYDHSRVALNAATNVSGSDYINASTITDHDPRNPAYIATQGPLPHTVADFWQMIWEQGSVVIVNLTRLTENGQAMCHRYWPEEGSDLYHIYEVHLVSEHIWCDDYLVRSFYLKNLQTNETRTVTQFHFLTWMDLGIPGSAKALLDFRRKVNKSYRGRSCPVVVHCSDGSGRSGTYSLVDMVLNRMSKGAKEIDIAATLEHIRDQRMQMVKTKEQFEFALAAVAEEVHAILKALPQ